MASLESNKLTILGFLLLILGGILLFQHFTPQRLAFSNFQPQYPISKLNHQSRIIIPSLNMDLEIFPARIIRSSWETTTQGISHLSSSPIPGEKGNSILYGHNWTNLLGNLTKIRPGDTINIVYNNSQPQVQDKILIQYIRG